MDSFVCLSVLLDWEGGLEDRPPGWPHFVISVEELSLSGLSLLVDAGSMTLLSVSDRCKISSVEILSGKSTREVHLGVGQIWRSPPPLGMTTPGMFEEPENELNGELCCNFPHLNWHSLPEPRCILTNKYFSSPCLSDYTGHSIQIKRQNVSLISTVMWDR